MAEERNSANPLEHRVTKPLPSKDLKSRNSKKNDKPVVPVKSSPKFRDITEDDDGYHPYCDGPERYLEHEEDPWR